MPSGDTGVRADSSGHRGRILEDRIEWIDGDPGPLVLAGAFIRAFQNSPQRSSPETGDKKIDRASQHRGWAAVRRINEGHRRRPVRPLGQHG